MSDMDKPIEFVSVEKQIASSVAKEFGLNPRYFAQVINADTLNKDITILKFKHITLVYLPTTAYKYLYHYTATILTKDSREADFEYILDITSKMRIGFWK
ncbi:MAG: hypothetical protein QM493_10370 [Sulfurovum sp.]